MVDFIVGRILDCMNIKIIYIRDGDRKMMFLTRGILIRSVFVFILRLSENIQTVEILRPNWAEATLKATQRQIACRDG